jgi:hypothetical protein
MESRLSRQGFDRRLYRAASLIFALIVIVGFGRSYYFAGVFGGQALPASVQVHGVLMSLWVAVFFLQVRLVASRRIVWHRRLGMATVGLAALIVITGVPVALRAARYGSPSTPPGFDPLDFLVVPLGDLVVFAIVFGSAIALRKRPAIHKQLMLLTAINFLPPALGRVPVLQQLGPLWSLGVPAVLLGLCIWLDARRSGRVSRVLAGGGLLLAASYVARFALIAWPGWTSVATWLVGFV